MILHTKTKLFIIPLVFCGLKCFIVQVSMAKGPPIEGPEPSFAEPIPNITVAIGRDVTFPCVVENLGNYKVAWIHTDRHTLLTLHDRLITRNVRYSINHNSQRTWMLHISDVEDRDKGEYMCQINTSPMKSQVGYLEVVVPPKIEEQGTSSDTDVREGHDVSMRCTASGVPPPKIKWRREDDKDISLGTKKVPAVQGEFLNITKTSRLHMGAYLCIASNGVLPSVSKRIMLKILFPPMMTIPNQLVGAAVGTDVTLDCVLESYPPSVTYWTHDGVMMISNNKYDSMIIDTGIYKIQMKLHIRNLHRHDYGSYMCIAKNPLGNTEGNIKLYEIPRPTSTTTTSKTSYSNVKTEGTQQTSSEKIIISTWHNSQAREDNSAKKSNAAGEMLGVDSNMGIVPSSAGQDLVEQDAGKTKTRNTNNKSPNISSSDSTLIYTIYLLLTAIIYLCKL